MKISFLHTKEFLLWLFISCEDNRSMILITQVLASITVISTVLAVFWKKVWWIRVFDFPRVQLIILQLLAFIGFISFWEGFSWFNFVVILLTFIAFIIQVIYVFPYFTFSKKQVPDNEAGGKPTFSVMVSNVLMKNRKSKKLIKLVRQHNPDILLMVETDHWWANEVEELETEYPHWVKYPLENTYGMILYSKKELGNTEIKFIIRENVPSIHADIIIDGSSIRAICIHPEPPAPDEADTSRPRDRELLRIASMVKDKAQPTIVLGDLNDVAWSDTSYRFQRISNLKDPRKGRGFFNTYHAKLPMVRWALDHIFLSGDFKLSKIKKLSKVGSDHFPIYVELFLKDVGNN